MNTRRKRGRFRASALLLAIGALAACFGTPEASAKVRAGTARVSSELKGLKWGATVTGILARYQGQIEASYAKRLAGISDPLTMDRIRRDRDDEIALLAKRVVKLDGARTRYAVSAIEGEFRLNNGEEVFVAPVIEATQNYFLFRHQALFKVVVVHRLGERAKRLAFTEFIDGLKRVYGKPRQFEYAGADESEITAAEWSDGATRLIARDKSDVFLAYLVVLADERERAASLGREAAPAASTTDDAYDELSGKKR
ncbi:MAG: hypothetical protein HYY84_19060 [Deltaproteobacteria bacterium]|nr:hypothetical protein [Deltaproteobacteria bacterium]